MAIRHSSKIKPPKEEVNYNASSLWPSRIIMASWIWRYYELKPERYCCWVIISVKIRTQCGNLGCVFVIRILLPPTPLLNNDVFWKACVWLPECLGIHRECISLGSYHPARQPGPGSKTGQQSLFTLKCGNSTAKVKMASALALVQWDVATRPSFLRKLHLSFGIWLVWVFWGGCCLVLGFFCVGGFVSFRGFSTL